LLFQEETFSILDRPECPEFPFPNNSWIGKKGIAEVSGADFKEISIFLNLFAAWLLPYRSAQMCLL
jgi:hypothetical protein